MTGGLVFGTVAGAILAWAAAEWWRGEPQRRRWARTAWTIGAILMSIHAIAAFMLLYGGSHATAVAATARQTAALTGIESGTGIWVNYVFLATWIVDAAWWWVAPLSYATRSRLVSAVIRASFLFLFVNGAVIFADGWMRVLGSVAVATAVLAWFRESGRRSSSHAPAVR